MNRSKKAAKPRWRNEPDPVLFGKVMRRVDIRRHSWYFMGAPHNHLCVSVCSLSRDNVDYEGFVFVGGKKAFVSKIRKSPGKVVQDIEGFIRMFANATKETFEL